ncbi:MAG TPA: NAD(P)/FAD-dependent oxidoreductase [Polyangiales bacterium]|nr:NAD(P)/FAD-dependent oxidoreductase [Polyangiales bacterium]
MSQTAASEYFDVLIVGAGLSGIGAAYHLQTRCPGKTYAILEARAQSGGTWDLFRYPGIRSDSDMYTLGYSFRPWREPEAIASGSAILGYLRQTALDYGIDRKIRYNQRVERASWSTADATWTVEVKDADGGRQRIRCNFLYMCSGYYDYEQGYTPDFPGVEDFGGRIVHPQKWTEDIDYAGKRVVVIGSGATAVTLVPELAKTAAHVTMLQRSPTYVIARPSIDPLANKLRSALPRKLAYILTRWKSVLLGMLFFRLCKRVPDFVKGLILRGVRRELGPDYDIRKHFTPRYKPWDQRLCLVPNGDLFAAIRQGSASVVTDHIQRFVQDGIQLQSGETLPADLIVTATGLNMRPLGGVDISVDGKPIDLPRSLTYKGMMLSDVPNLAQAGGYTNASWTLKCDLTAEYVCRLLEHMRKRGLRQCTPRNRDSSVKPENALDFTSGYVQRALPNLPKQGDKAPWRLHQNYAQDLLTLRYGSITDGVMIFTNPVPTHDTATISSLPPARYDHADQYDRPAP